MMLQRICKRCDKTFSGGPRAWYCEDCRKEREKERKKQYKNGPLRPIGSKSTCNICGNEYTVASGNQKYCPDCKVEAVKAVDREQGLKYYTENKNEINPKRNERRRYKRRCKICGKDFISANNSGCCSAECRRILKNYMHRTIYDKRYRHKLKSKIPQG